ncbi:MAG: transposase, partial [Candidatus Microthrix parvicella]
GRFYELLGPERCEKIEAVSMDMAYAYPAATRKATNATICWDPFHVVMVRHEALCVRGRVRDPPCWSVVADR